MRHFISKQGQYICYDLYGRQGDQFLLYKDISTKISLSGKLRDDYYFGSVELKSSYANITIQASPIWSIRTIFNNDLIKIEALNDDEIQIIIKKQIPTILIIEKAKNIAGLFYLNVHINQMDEKTSSGLFGMQKGKINLKTFSRFVFFF